jgi:pimeloyl-ACP methyl ester carboxylesterase
MDDLALPPSNIDGIAQLVPDVTIAPVENCGHFVIWEQHDAVNAAMDRFLS